jgi:hypothetical protein
VRVHVAATDASKKRGKDVPQKIGRDDAAEILQQMQKSFRSKDIDANATR